MRRQQALVPLDVSHLPERFGLFTILVLGESITAVVAGVAHASWSLRHVITATTGIGIATAIWWMYFDNTSGTVVRRSADIRHTWRPTTWIYTHLLLAAAVAALGVALELAVEDAGEGPMRECRSMAARGRHGSGTRVNGAGSVCGCDFSDGPPHQGSGDESAGREFRSSWPRAPSTDRTNVAGAWRSGRLCRRTPRRLACRRPAGACRRVSELELPCEPGHSRSDDIPFGSRLQRSVNIVEKGVTVSRVVVKGDQFGGTGQGDEAAQLGE